MESVSDGLRLILDSIVSQLDAIAGNLPGILAIVLILVLGWIVARIARRLTRRFGDASNQFLARAFPSGIFSGARMSSLVVTLLGEVVFWATILVAITMAARFAEMGPVSQWLEQITANLPNLIAGIAIVVVGYFLSVFVREQLDPQSGARGTSMSPLAGNVAQSAVIAIAFIIALDQIGIDVVLLVALTVVVAAAILMALAVAFALSARTHICNLIGVRGARSNISVGMTIQIGEIVGEVVELTTTVVALETDVGRMLVPGKLVDESVITVVRHSTNQEADNA
jgi:hypothetical protein